MAVEKRNPAFSRMISDFVKQRGSGVLPPRDTERLREHLVRLFHEGRFPHVRGGGIDWLSLAAGAGIEPDPLVTAKSAFRPGVEALRRELRKPAREGFQPAAPSPAPALTSKAASPTSPKNSRLQRQPSAPAHPEPSELMWQDPPTFAEAIDLHMSRHGDTTRRLQLALARHGISIETSTLRMWRRGLKAPKHCESLRVLALLEDRWRLPAGYFQGKLPHPGRATSGHLLLGISKSEQRRLAWHLPDDFSQRPLLEQEEILEWVRRVVVSGSTEYRRYQAAAATQPFALRFRSLEVRLRDRRRSRQGTRAAPAELEAEMEQLLDFKTATLSPYGYQRRGVWGPETAAQKLEQLSLLFGALASDPQGPIRGAGVAVEDLSFGMLALPRVWDWYVTWRERRRGFFTAWEADMLALAVALNTGETGWLSQTPGLAHRLVPIRGLVTTGDVEEARSDWSKACASMHRIALARSKEIGRVARVHRDPFEPILPVLEADSPVGEYRKIADEILRLRPCGRRYPKAAAESSRALLMIRLGLHLGFRQKNLRQLLVCRRGEPPRTERQLDDAKRGELRWNDREQGWEVFVPSAAFKNSGSSFFAGRPFRLLLPDIANLYTEIEAYLATHRARLLGAAQDPGTLFVKTVKVTTEDAAYDQNTFYEAWRWITQRYGIFNPWTGRGAIKGLLPHGPHNVRDVLATHILKLTGSYEQASYAIQDTPDTVAAHYGRFLPQDKAAIAAEVLNKAWQEA